MYRSLFGLAALASVLVLPLAAHADTIDDLVITGGGHTISYSLPATNVFPNFEFLYASAIGTIDGVPGYLLQQGYASIPAPVGILQLFVPEAVFGYQTIMFQGPQILNSVYIPSDDPFNPINIEATFIPGTYSLIGEGMLPGTLPGPELPYTLTITPQTATAATPEPSSVALLATGVFSLLGFAAVRHGRIKLTS